MLSKVSRNKMWPTKTQKSSDDSNLDKTQGKEKPVKSIHKASSFHACFLGAVYYHVRLRRISTFVFMFEAVRKY